MISKIRKYQDSWVTKAILALTALSFMSLFGITGYVNSANKNRAVIKVDNFEILQDEMNAKLNNSIRKAKNMFGDSIEITEDLRKSILLGLIKENLNHMIILREAQKENVNISDMLNRSKGSYAATMLDLDSPVSDAVVAHLQGIDGVLRVRKIK